MLNPDQRNIQDLLDLLSNPNYRQQDQKVIAGPDGCRVTDAMVDDTSIDENSNTRVNRSDLHTILDCGHCSTEQVGGCCHFCDALACRECICLCYSCRLATCPSCSTVAEFDGNSRTYCRRCAEEIARSLTLKRIGRSLLSFFIE